MVIVSSICPFPNKEIIIVSLLKPLYGLWTGACAEYQLLVSQEACQLLPEISSPTIHPKVAQVLLERENPDAALMVLRWSGQDGTQLVSLREAVTAVRVRVECGLLTEAFTYQRLVCARIKEKKLRGEEFQSASVEVEDQCWSWGLWMETLVTEICCLCIRRNLVDHMIELPWNADEEKHLHKYLLDFTAEDPSTAIGSLLVVFYLQVFLSISRFHVLFCSFASLLLHSFLLFWQLIYLHTCFPLSL